MIKSIGVAFAFTALLASTAQADADLEVVFDGCDPIEVISSDDSCGQGGDPVDLACRDSGATVRWIPGDQIAQISTKAGSPGSLHNCKSHPQGKYYQCIVTGNQGDEVAYDVTSTGGCVLDPIIRLR